MARILVVGSGAREHALCTALKGGGVPHYLVIAPGNGGTEGLGKNVSVAIDDVSGLVALAVAEAVDLVVVGPELPLVLGLVDALEARGIRAFGPSRAAARLEGSKAFMKDMLATCGVPTAAFSVFDDMAAAKDYVRAADRPLVVKADGLCGGKGVVVAANIDEALDAIDGMRAFGEAGARIVIEEVLPGDEASFHVVCDGVRAIALVPAQDHKRAFDGDRGPNTGGMGAYAPAPVVTPELHADVMTNVVEPTLRGMAAAGAPFKGVLFVGLMIDHGAAKVLEFNVRFGDPEATVIVPMFDGDWFSLLDGAARGDLSEVRAGTKPGAAVAVVMAAEGYPGKVTNGDRIEGLDAPRPESLFVCHAGTRRDGDHVVTSGGRVLAVGARASTFAAARARAYEAVATIGWRGEHHRMDIGNRHSG